MTRSGLWARSLRALKIFVPALLLASCSPLILGCFLIQRYYVDPTLPRRSYADLEPRKNPRPLYAGARFTNLGRANTTVTPKAQELVRNALAGSKLFSTIFVDPVEGADSLEVVIDNSGDVKEAFFKGMGTGVTFGLIPAALTERYSFTATYQTFGAEPVEKVYAHALLATLGIAEPPEGLTAIADEETLGKIIEDLILNLLYDLQKEGYLTDRKPRG